MQPPFAAGRDEPVGRQHLQHVLPARPLAARRQALGPESVELQFAPKDAGEPACAPLAAAQRRTTCAITIVSPPRTRGRRSNNWSRRGPLSPCACAAGGTRPICTKARAPAASPKLLPPFDPLIWSRPRSERLFGFRYRREIYTSAHKREHGYYVLPFLMDGALVARVDLKADRKGGALLVQRAHVEPGAQHDAVERLIEELRLMASWLGLFEPRRCARRPPSTVSSRPWTSRPALRFSNWRPHETGLSSNGSAFLM